MNTPNFEQIDENDTRKRGLGEDGEVVEIVEGDIDPALREEDIHELSAEEVSAQDLAAEYERQNIDDLPPDERLALKEEFEAAMAALKEKKVVQMKPDTAEGKSVPTGSLDEAIEKNRNMRAIAELKERIKALGPNDLLRGSLLRQLEQLEKTAIPKEEQKFADAA